MNRAVRGIAGGVAVAALTLTGCAQPPSAAAVVGDVRIPQTVAQDAGAALATVTGANTASSLQQAAFDLVVGEAATQIAQKQNLSFSDAQRADVLSVSTAAQAVVATPGGAAWGQAVTTTYLTLQQMGEADFARELAGIPISINPRFGTWDPTQLTMVDSSLSTALR